VGTDINASVIITSAVTLKQKKSFFFLLQSDLGDVYVPCQPTTIAQSIHTVTRYRVALEQDGDNVAAINMHYFETLPVSSSMAVLRSGYLFVATEMGAHRL
jgi:splicing factor 3B subunit 3